MHDVRHTSVAETYVIFEDKRDAIRLKNLYANSSGLKYNKILPEACDMENYSNNPEIDRWFRGTSDLTALFENNNDSTTNAEKMIREKSINLSKLTGSYPEREIMNHNPSKAGFQQSHNTEKKAQLAHHMVRIMNRFSFSDPKDYMYFHFGSTQLGADFDIRDNIWHVKAYSHMDGLLPLILHLIERHPNIKFTAISANLYEMTKTWIIRTNGDATFQYLNPMIVGLEKNTIWAYTFSLWSSLKGWLGDNPRNELIEKHFRLTPSGYAVSKDTLQARIDHFKLPDTEWRDCAPFVLNTNILDASSQTELISVENIPDILNEIYVATYNF